MDTSNLPENEPEEITWQDDENRATLFLRSVFVLLSGALILMTQATTSTLFDQIGLASLYILGMNIALPVCIIWLFFGQGLRPVEWLTDQKYNAWNYGLNFKDWKTHFRWVIPLLVVGIGGILIYKMLFLGGSTSITLGEWATTTAILWFCGICFAWLLFGFLWFGCAQGFGPIAATGCIIAVLLSYGYMQRSSLQDIVLTVLAFLPFILLGSCICWKQKSWIPLLYSVLLLAPIASCILVF